MITPDAAVPKLIIAMAVSVPTAFWIVALTSWMLQGDLDALPGFLGIGIAIGLMVVAIWQPVHAVSLTIIVVMVASAAFFPFAYSQLMRREHKVLDTDELEKAHIAFAAHPDNKGARFAIARALVKHGLKAHAIAIGEDAVSGLSTEIDPVANRSERDIYHRELREIQNWKESLAPAERDHKVQCIRCQAVNPPGSIECRGCGGPYLLDAARKRHLRSAFIGRLVASWAIIAAVVPAGAWIGSHTAGSRMAALLLLLIAATALAVHFVFREKRIA